MKDAKETDRVREGLSEVDIALWERCWKREAKLRKAEAAWRRGGEVECAAIYQGAAFELELIREWLTKRKGKK